MTGLNLSDQGPRGRHTAYVDHIDARATQFGDATFMREVPTRTSTSTSGRSTQGEGDTHWERNAETNRAWKCQNQILMRI